jgi:hypothetical protein
MSAKKNPTNKRIARPAEGLLATTARTVGTVAGKVAAGLGLSGSAAPEPKPAGKASPKKAAPGRKRTAKHNEGSRPATKAAGVQRKARKKPTKE